MQHLIRNTRIHRLQGHHSYLKKSTQSTGKVIDMQGFEGCLFLFVAGTSAGRGATTKTVALVKGCSSTSGTFYAINGTSSTALWTTGTLDYKVHAIDVYRPLSTHRYLRPITYGCSTGQLDCILAIQYGARRPGATDMWKATTSPTTESWRSSQLAAQVLSVGDTATTGTTAVSGATAP